MFKNCISISMLSVGIHARIQVWKFFFRLQKDNIILYVNLKAAPLFLGFYGSSKGILNS